jgi:FixJ family two-component response regulator
MAPKIVIVEDDASVRRAFRMLLESAGFHTVDFPSAEAFIESGHFDTSDCIITDLYMPGLTGFDFLERLHAQGHATPVIVVTAFSDAANRERSRLLGVKAFFGKPIDDQALVDAIHWAIEEPDFLITGGTPQLKRELRPKTDKEKII